MRKKAKIPETKKDEKVLAVKREVLFPDKTVNGLCFLEEDELQNLLEIIKKDASFLPRGEIEEDETFKQIIPYLVFCFEDKIFLMRRHKNHSDARIADCYTIGIGGHIREEEFSGNDIFSWARREFEEEVSYRGDFEILPLGLLNDESNSIGRVHTGLVLKIVGLSPLIKVKDEHKSGRLLDFVSCQTYYDQMENWSKIVFESLKKLNGCFRTVFKD